MNEHGFIKAVHRHLSPEVYRWKIHDTYTGGVPDAFYLGPAGSLWVEYKYVKLPKRPDTIVTFGISKLQAIWLTRAQECGQLAAVIIGFDKQAQIVDNPEQFNTMTQRELQDGALSFQCVADWIENHVISGGYGRDSNAAESGAKSTPHMERKKRPIRNKSN